MNNLNDSFKAEKISEIRQMIEIELRRELLIETHETVELDCNFFDLGITSLGLQKIKQNLETSLNRPIDSADLFNYPTINRLTTFLSEETSPTVIRGFNLLVQSVDESQTLPDWGF